MVSNHDHKFSDLRQLAAGVAETAVIRDCLADACLEGEEDQIADVLRRHLEFASASCRPNAREEVTAEVKRFADRLQDIDDAMSDYWTLYSKRLEDEQQSTFAKQKEFKKTATMPTEPPSPCGTAQAIRTSTTNVARIAIPQLKPFVPAREYSGRNAALNNGNSDPFDGSSETKEHDRHGIAEKLKMGLERRRQNQQEAMNRVSRDEACDTHRSEPSRLRSDPFIQSRGWEDTTRASTPKYNWNEASSTAYSFCFERNASSSSASTAADGSLPTSKATSSTDTKPNTEYSFRYVDGEKRTYTQTAPTSPDVKSPSVQSQIPRPTEGSPRKVNAAGGPRLGQSCWHEGTGPGAPPRPPQPQRPPSANGTSSKPFGGFSCPSPPSGPSGRRPGGSGSTRPWNRTGWGTGTAGWNMPRGPPQAKAPPPSQNSSQQSKQPPPRPPPKASSASVASAVAAARTPGEVSAVTSLEARLQELRRLSKEDQRKGVRELMIRWHPDKNLEKGEESTRIFQWLQNRKREVLGA
eukprot:TRINITY_DN20208_c0_g1_i1.p1 TRINITY_DN20208_c0_g1~~TRINITY_DN20208_c0_g1_i1.p1  ORF type:complete len:523 (-),score=106.38 TRINITY_DN20208_c0_g1_i1:274-1842(-)